MGVEDHKDANSWTKAGMEVFSCAPQERAQPREVPCEQRRMMMMMMMKMRLFYFQGEPGLCQPL